MHLHISSSESHLRAFLLIKPILKILMGGKSETFTLHNLTVPETLLHLNNSGNAVENTNHTSAEINLRGAG